MAYVYHASSPVEASFVENFFVEKGHGCKTVATSGNIGLLGFDVYVEGNIDDLLMTELRTRLQEIELNNSDEAPDKMPPANKSPLSLFGTLGILALTEMMRLSLFTVTFGFTRFGEGLVASAPVLGFVYIYCRKKLGNGVSAFFGFVPVAIGPLVFWLLVESVYKTGFMYFYDHYPNVFSSGQRSPIYLPTALLLAPVFEEILYRGFVLRSLEYAVKIGPALVVSSFLFGAMHYQDPWPLRFAIMGSGLLAGLARVHTGSIFVPIGMHALGNLIAYTVYFK